VSAPAHSGAVAGASVGEAQRLPPVTHLPKHVPLAPAVALLAASVLVLAANLAMLARVRGFAWGTFFAVARWAALAYALIAGMIEYVFLRNHTSGGPLVVLTLSLVVFAIHVPVLIGFTVARYR